MVVDFFNGDPDMPFVIGRLTNPDNMPVWNLPSQQALSGIKSKEFKGSGSNQLVMDDTPGNLQIHLKSDHQSSELNLGHITRIPDSSGRKDFRGEGFELRTDGHGVVRSAQGLFVTTFEAKKALEGISYRPETEKLFKNSWNINYEMKQMIDKTVNNNVKKVDSETEALEKNIGNEDVKKGYKLANSNMLLSSQSTITLLAKDDFIGFSDQELNLSSNKNTDINAGENLLLSSFENVQLTGQKNVKVNALLNDVEIQAQKANIRMNAKNDIEIATVNKKITLTSPEEISIKVGGSYLTIKKDGIELGTSGKFVVHSSEQEFSGAKTTSFKLPTFNNLSSWLQVGLRNVEDDQPFKNIDYILKMNSGKEIKGTLNEDGESNKVNVDESGVASVEYIFPPGEPENPYKDYKTLSADFDELISSTKGGSKS